jgi:hypothetical protein
MAAGPPCCLSDESSREVCAAEVRTAEVRTEQNRADEPIFGVKPCLGASDRYDAKKVHRVEAV